MAIQYFKRYRMEYDLRRLGAPAVAVSEHYRFLPWRDRMVEPHAEVLCLSFRFEIDANVFVCLGHDEGCLRLMAELSRRPDFAPEATWLLKYAPPGKRAQPCGAIQGIHDEDGVGSIQNVAVTPEHRGLGLASALLCQALLGYQSVGCRRVALEVTAENKAAIRLYERFGFTRHCISYKAVEMECV